MLATARKILHMVVEIYMMKVIISMIARMSKIKVTREMLTGMANTPLIPCFAAQ